MKTKYLRNIILSLAYILAVSLTFAQPSGPSDPPGGGPGSGDPPVGGGEGAPVSGGMFFLLAAGLVYGGKKLFDLSIKNEDQVER